MILPQCRGGKEDKGFLPRGILEIVRPREVCKGMVVRQDCGNICQSYLLVGLCKPPLFYVQVSYRGKQGGGRGKIKRLAHSGRWCSHPDVLPRTRLLRASERILSHARPRIHSGLQCLLLPHWVFYSCLRIMTIMTANHSCTEHKGHPMS
jgi:hypothetical protein